MLMEIIVVYGFLCYFPTDSDIKNKVSGSQAKYKAPLDLPGPSPDSSDTSLLQTS